jgi:hypothetical protein
MWIIIIIYGLSSTYYFVYINYFLLKKEIEITFKVISISKAHKFYIIKGKNLIYIMLT